MSNDTPQRKAPHVSRSTTPRRPSVEAVYKGHQMRSLFEVSFAKQLDAHDIAWAYEPERIGGGRYLVDFHLPDLKCWVEVKGRFEARDDLLLPLASTRLEQERGERLFLYMKTRCYHVTRKGFVALIHEEFWVTLQEVPKPREELRLPKRKSGARRRPWDKG